MQQLAAQLDFALALAVRDDGPGGELARLELRPIDRPMWIFAPNFNDKQTKRLRMARKLLSITPLATRCEDSSNHPQFQQKTMTLFRGS